METLRRAYNNLQGFVDDFANSTTRIRPVTPQKVNMEAWYAEWDDNYMGDLIDNKIVKKILRRIADHYYGDELCEILEQATELTAATYPCMHSVYDDCCNTLGMFNQPKAYITGRMKGINALSLEVCGKQLILISPKVVTHLSAKEQAFLLGHEISHHQQGNLVCHTVNGLIERMGNSSEIFGPLVMDALEVPLKRWCKCSEQNADRAGYICCKDLDSIRTLFNRISDGIRLKDYKNVLELTQNHPLIESRLRRIEQYSHAFECN